MAKTITRATHEITLASALALTDFGFDLAEQRGLRVSIAVTDRSGGLVGFLRMDGAPLVTIEVAIGKARSAAYLQAPTKLFEDFINAGLPSMTTTPGILPLQGGVPILYNNEIIGAVGVSGASGEVDNELARSIAGHLN